MTRILVIPGIGDIHWVALKLQSFIAQNCPGERPEVYIWNFDGRPRSEDFVRRLPFVTFGGYWDEPLSVDSQTFRQAYMTGEVDVVQGFQGFDWFLCFNGSLRVGRGMTEILPECDVDWDYPIDAHPHDGVLASTMPDRYVLAYFSDHGMFGSHWVPRFGPERIRKLLSRIKVPVVLTGSEWDAAFAERLHASNTLDLVGQTSFADLMGMIRGCEAFVGWCGGNTILASHMGVPTLMLWSDYFNIEFRTNWANPSTLGTSYRPVGVETIDEAAEPEWINGWIGNSATA